MAEKMISINQLESMMTENVVVVPYCEGSDINIVIKKCISLPEMCSFVENVVESCFSDDGKYMPYIKDFAIRVNVMTIFANFRLPKSVEKQYDLAYQTEAYYAVLNHIDLVQFDQICYSIDDAIAHRRNMEIASATNEVAKAAQTLSNLNDQFADVMGGLTNHDMEQLLDKMSGMTLDEDKLVSAIMRAKSEGAQSNVISLPKK